MENSQTYKCLIEQISEEEVKILVEAGAHRVKKKRISITTDEAEICQLDVDEMYNIILQYQNDGVYGDDIFE